MNPLARRIERSWDGTGLLTLALLPLSWLFGALSGLRRALYRAGLLRVERLPCPVIVVGNISVGGSGKTPLVVYLAQRLAASGFRPGIVSRGYGAAQAAPRAVVADSRADTVGDEPLLLARRTAVPVWVGHDRAATARALLAAHPAVDVLLCDDGLQHYRLGRDLEIAVLDRRGPRNGRLLPAGPLREPVSRLHGVDALVTHTDGVPWPAAGNAPRFAMTLAGDELVNLRDSSRRLSAAQLRGRKVYALAGIGEPERFFETLRSLGLAPVCHAFADHHRFAAGDLDVGPADALLMTEKDAVKCAQFAPDHAWYLPVEAALAPDLAQFVAERLLEKRHGSASA